jgi:hypothetical protein
MAPTFFYILKQSILNMDKEVHGQITNSLSIYKDSCIILLYSCYGK